MDLYFAMMQKQIVNNMEYWSIEVFEQQNGPFMMQKQIVNNMEIYWSIWTTFFVWLVHRAINQPTFIIRFVLLLMLVSLSVKYS